MVGDSVSGALTQGLATLFGDEGEALQVPLIAYLDLMQHWNRRYNLTAVRDPLEMVHRHLLDSLATASRVPAAPARIIDVGTGAGLPGVPLALLRPTQPVDLLDSNGKKTRFLFQVKTALGLDNMTIRHSRAEDWTPTAPYDVVISRAFASLLDMVKCCAHLCAAEGRFLAMKGAWPQQELDAVAGVCEIVGVYPLQVPGLQEARHLVELAPLPGLHEGKQT